MQAPYVVALGDVGLDDDDDVGGAHAGLNRGLDALERLDAARAERDSGARARQALRDGCAVSRGRSESARFESSDPGAVLDAQRAVQAPRPARSAGKARTCADAAGRARHDRHLAAQRPRVAAHVGWDLRIDSEGPLRYLDFSYKFSSCSTTNGKDTNLGANSRFKSGCLRRVDQAPPQQQTAARSTQWVAPTGLTVSTTCERNPATASQIHALVGVQPLARWIP